MRPHRVEVIFLVARISDDPDLESNINARYTVEGVERTSLHKRIRALGLTRRPP